MSTEENKAIVRNMFEEVFNKGNLAAVDQLFAPNIVAHLDYPSNLPVPAEYQLSLEELKQVVSQFRTTFPDLHYTVELQVVEGDMVVTRVTARGTHTGEYRGLTYKGIPPTGKQRRRFFASLMASSWSSGQTKTIWAGCNRSVLSPRQRKPVSRLSHAFHLRSEELGSELLPSSFYFQYTVKIKKTRSGSIRSHS